MMLSGILQDMIKNPLIIPDLDKLSMSFSEEDLSRVIVKIFGEIYQEVMTHLIVLNSKRSMVTYGETKKIQLIKNSLRTDGNIKISV